MPDLIVPFLPEKGVIKDYLTFLGEGEECPRFRFFSFIAALGSIIKRKVYFQRGSKITFPTLYPSIWVILVAPQGVGKKSSTIRVGRNILESLPPQYKPKILAAKLTPEALVKALSSSARLVEDAEGAAKDMIHIIKKPAQGLLYSSEFGVLLGREKYNTGMIALLADLYDCPDEWNSETIMHGDQKLYDVCLSVMGASTPDWLQSMLPTDAFKGGFMSRLLLVTQPDDWYIRVSNPPPPPIPLSDIVDKVVRIATFKGEMTWSKEAELFFDEWYMALPKPEPGPKAQYLERKQDHLLRLSMILQLTYGGMEIQGDTLKQALNILNSVEKETLKIIDYISVEPRMRCVQRILEYLDTFPFISEAELLDRTWKYMARPSEFEEAMRMLLRAKRVEMRMKDGEVYYKLKEEK